MRKLALALALLAAALSAADYLAWRGGQRRLRALVASVDPASRLPQITAGLGRETVTARAAARVGWRLLRVELDRRWLAELPADEASAESRRELDRLRLARRLAGQVLTRQPASWRAAAVLGASRYLEASRLGRRDQPIDAWRQPLAAAMRLAPSQTEPPLLLASFYLSRWSSLSPADRDELSPVLARAFEDSRSRRRLLPVWVQLAPSLDRLLEPIPDRPAAWRELGQEFLGRGDLERFGESHRRRMGSLAADLAERVERGKARLRGGQPRAGLGLLRSVFSAPPDLAYADSLAAALAALPRTPAGREARRDLADWLQWARDLCAVDRCPLADETMARLAAAAGGDGAAARVDLPPRSSWSADQWRRRGSAYRLPLRTAGPAGVLRLEIPAVPAGGAPLELRWDGRFLGVVVVQPGEPLVWTLADAAGAHLLEVRRLGGRPLRPGGLTLEPPRARG